MAAEIFHRAQAFSSTLAGPILTKVGRARSGQQSSLLSFQDSG
jgi:hypothetical protein